MNSIEDENKKSMLRGVLDWNIGKTVGAKLHGQQMPDIIGPQKQLKAIVSEWFDKPISELSIGELMEALARVQTMGKVIQRSKEQS